MNETSDKSTKARRSSRITLILIFLIFVAPTLGAWLWFNFGMETTHHSFGTLYQPARPVEAISFATPQGDRVDISQLRGNWQLLLVDATPCDDDCLVRLDKANRIRLSMGKNIKRIGIIHLSLESAPVTMVEKITTVIPLAILGSLDETEFQRMESLLTHSGEDVSDTLSRLYLMDPIGNLVLSYPEDANPEEVRKDLARLLRASQIG